MLCLSRHSWVGSLTSKKRVVSISAPVYCAEGTERETARGRGSVESKETWVDP